MNRPPSYPNARNLHRSVGGVGYFRISRRYANLDPIRRNRPADCVLPLTVGYPWILHCLSPVLVPIASSKLPETFLEAEDDDFS